MVETVGIVTQFVDRKNRILNPANSDFYISRVLLRGKEKAHPIKGRCAVPPVNEQNGAENIARVYRCFSQFVGWLQVHFLYGVFGEGLVLIKVYPGAGFDRGFGPHDLCRDRP